MRFFRNPFESKEPREIILIRDAGIMLLSIFATILLVTSGTIGVLLNHSLSFEALGAFIAGIFFTSVFTTAPATAVFVYLGVEQAPLSLAFLGALGALLGDLIIFSFIRDSVAEDIAYILERRPRFRLFHIGETRLSRWLTPLLGALIIASPLPDELGIALMGFSKMGKRRFMLISFTMNFLGILAIMAVARAING